MRIVIMEQTTKVFSDLNQLTDYLVNCISNQLLNKKKGQYYSIALSGGSTPLSIFKIIAEKYNNKIDWKRVALFWGDERCVPPSDSESNYRMTYENLFKYLNIPELNFCRIIGENDPEDEAKRYSDKVDSMLPHFNGIPQFDLILLGLGEDGHTASIFPYNIELFHSQKWFETSAHPVTKQMRVTATGILINNAREVFYIVTGSGKAQKVSQIINHHPGWETLPASLVKPTAGQLVWLLDEAAASLL